MMSSSYPDRNGKEYSMAAEGAAYPKTQKKGIHGVPRTIVYSENYKIEDGKEKLKVKLED